jgi:hypothetical protein
MNSPIQADQKQEKKVYVSLSGLPLSFRLEWPFRKSTSGADFYVLHADIALENSEGLHAPVSVNLSATVYEVMPSLEPKDIEAPVIMPMHVPILTNNLRSSGVPVQFSSQYYDFKRSVRVFSRATKRTCLLVAAKFTGRPKSGGPV